MPETNSNPSFWSKTVNWVIKHPYQASILGIISIAGLVVGSFLTYGLLTALFAAKLAVFLAATAAVVANAPVASAAITVYSISNTRELTTENISYYNEIESTSDNDSGSELSSFHFEIASRTQQQSNGFFKSVLLFFNFKNNDNYSSSLTP